MANWSDSSRGKYPELLAQKQTSEQEATLQGPDPWRGIPISLSSFVIWNLGTKSDYLNLSYHFRFCTQKCWKITSSTEESNFWLTYPKLQTTVYWYSHRGSQQHIECHISSPQPSWLFCKKHTGVGLPRLRATVEPFFTAWWWAHKACPNSWLQDQPYPQECSGLLTNFFCLIKTRHRR